MSVDPRAQKVLTFWFGEGFETAGKGFVPFEKMPLWFGGGPEVDKAIAEQFSADLEDLAAGKLEAWRDHPLNCMAGIIVMDQFSRNMFRGQPRMFAQDPRAREWSRHALAQGYAAQLPAIAKLFLQLPFEHSEELEDQQRSLALGAEILDEAQGLGVEPLIKFAETCIKFAEDHHAVISKWGRFPHRNKVLGRPSTAEEEQGLKDGSIHSF